MKHLVLSILYAVGTSLFVGLGWTCARYGPSPHESLFGWLACVVAFALCGVASTLCAAAGCAEADAWWVGRTRRRP